MNQAVSTKAQLRIKKALSVVDGCLNVSKHSNKSGACLLIGSRISEKILSEILCRRMRAWTVDVEATTQSTPKGLSLAMLYSLGVRDEYTSSESEVTRRLIECFKQRGTQLILINKLDLAFTRNDTEGSLELNKWLTELIDFCGITICIIGATDLYQHLETKIIERLTDSCFI